MKSLLLASVYPHKTCSARRDNKGDGILSSIHYQLWLALAISSGQGNGNPLQYSRLENPMDEGAW